MWSTTTQCPTLFFIATQAAMGSKAASSINKFQSELPRNTYLETPWSRIQGTSLHEQCIQPRYYASNSRKNRSQGTCCGWSLSDHTLGQNSEVGKATRHSSCFQKVKSVFHNHRTNDNRKSNDSKFDVSYRPGQNIFFQLKLRTHPMIPNNLTLRRLFCFLLCLTLLA